MLEHWEVYSTSSFLSFSQHSWTSTYLKNKNAHILEENIPGVLEFNISVLTSPTTSCASRALAPVNEHGHHSHATDGGLSSGNMSKVHKGAHGQPPANADSSGFQAVHKVGPIFHPQSGRDSNSPYILPNQGSHSFLKIQ